MEPDVAPPTLGALLREARERRGLSLADVGRDTRVRRRYLEALEADDFASLPPPVYTRGLVRSYAAYLGVDVGQALGLLEQADARDEPSGLVPAVDPANTPRFTQRSSARIGLLALVAALTLAVLYVGAPQYEQMLNVPPAGAQADTPSPEPTATGLPTAAPSATRAPTATPTSTVPPTNTPSPTATLSPEGRATATAAAAIRGVIIEARIHGRLWAQVESDGRVAFSGALMPGERRIWRAEKRVVMHAGDAGMVDVTFNGQFLGRMGESGEILRREWVATR